jgi:NADPH:quinone reductase-like Zn-dependent oxidoreductase
MTIAERKALAKIPDTISYEQAAVSLEAAHYAYNFITKVKLKAGDKTLVNGATGGIGSALVQFFKYLEVHVTAVGNSKNVEVLKSLGADRVVDYEQEDFTNDKEQYTFIFDAVGKSSFGKCKSLLQPKGIYISSELGAWSQNIFLALSTLVLGCKK